MHSPRPKHMRAVDIVHRCIEVVQDRTVFGEIPVFIEPKMQLGVRYGALFSVCDTFVEVVDFGVAFPAAFVAEQGVWCQ